jgi:NADPH2:quinone reductase
MKAIAANRIESLAAYAQVDLPVPAPRAGQVRIRVAAVGVGYVDSLIALGRYQVKPPTPHVPGGEIAGVVDALGEGVRSLRVGDRVLAMGQRGFAEFALAPAAMTTPLADSLSFEDAAALPLNHLTALHGLVDRGALKAGETVLVLGAAGGVGVAAVQIAKAMGARVIAVASTPEKRDFALRHGAEQALDTEPEGWRDRLKAALGETPLNLVFDPVCGPLFEPAFRSLGWNGRHLVVGFVGGPIPALKANLTLMKGAALIGVDVRQFTLFEADRAAGHLRTLTGWAGEGRFAAPIGRRFDWADFGEALTWALSGEGVGKTVLRLDGRT